MQTIILFILFLTLESYVFAQTILVTKQDSDTNVNIEEYQIDAKTKKNNGYYKTRYKNGDIRLVGYYIQGIPINIWQYYGKNKMLKMITNYDSLRKRKLKYRKYYYKNGNLQMEGGLRGNQLEGEWKYYYKDGKLQQRGLYRKNKKQGRWIYFNKERVLNAETIFTNNKGIYKEYYVDLDKKKIQKQGLILGNFKEGKWSYFTPKGNLSKIMHFQNGVKHGITQEFYPNQKLKSEGSYEKGVKSGLWISYHPNGKTNEKGNIQNGKKEGNWQLFNNKGEKLSETEFTEGKGMYKEYYNDSTLKVIGKVKDNKSYGPWKYYYNNGVLRGFCNFEYGKGKYIGYYKNGSRRIEGVLDNGNKIGVWRLYHPNGKIAGYYKTIYDNDKPQELETTQKGEVKKRLSIIPRYIYSKSKSRYFRPKINEYKSLILSSGLPAMAFSFYPVALESYIQERLGIALTYTHISHSISSSNHLFTAKNLDTRGHQIALKLKLYSKETSIGMIYFAHSLEYARHNYTSRTQNQAIENIYSYWFSVGSRLMKYVNRDGITLDGFIGFGVGNRDLKFLFDDKNEYSNFSAIDDNSIALPIRIGLNLGYAF